MKLECDFRCRPERPCHSQTGRVEVSYEGGSTRTNLLTLNEFNTTNTAGSAGLVTKSINERLVSGTATGVNSAGESIARPMTLPSARPQPEWS